MRRIFLVVLLAVITSPAGAADRSPLLPRPQHVTYGSGAIRVRGLGVRLPAEAAPEDWFAAKTLSACLSERAGDPIPVSQGEAAGRLIVLKRTGSVDPVPVPGEQAGPQSREAYSLKVSPDGIELSAASSAGLFYGAQTVCQLVEGNAAEAAIPEVEIHDWPAVPYRGVMIDMSHGPLPTVEEVERQLDFLALWKANQYYFYNEASIQLDGYPLINRRGRFTKDEVRRIVAYGRERHIDIVPCLELYGHLHDLFRVEKYSALADLPHGTEFDPRNPKVMALLTDWAHQFAQLFPSCFVHIGFDETFQIEIAAKESKGAANPAKLFVEQLTNVARLFQDNGKTVMAWGDIMVKYPEIVSELPKGLVAVAWEYDPGPEQHYQHWLGPLAAQHVPHVIATGVTSWNQIAPDFARSFENIDTFLAAGRKSGSMGIINTIWTDDGQMLMRMAWPGMAYGAAASWQSTPIDHQGFFPEYARLMYPPKVAPEVATALADLTGSELAIQKSIGDDSMLVLWANPFAPSVYKKCSANQEALKRTRLLAEDAMEHLDRALAMGGDPVTIGNLLFGAELLDYAGQKFQTAPELDAMWRRLGPKRPKDEVWWNEWNSQVSYQDHSRLVDLMDAITELRKSYQSEWLAEYTPYRLDSALVRWDAEADFWRKLQVRLDSFSNRSREGDALPALETLVPKD